MNRIVLFLMFCLALSAPGANPAFTDLNTSQFGTAGNKVVVKSGALMTNTVITSGTNYGSIGRTNFTWTDASGWHNTNTSAAGQGVDLNGGNFYFQATTSSGGVLYSDASRFLHNYGSGGLVARNTFVGSDAGNFTLGGESVNNTAVGYNALNLLTTGFQNTAVGTYALALNTSGNNLTAVGFGALINDTTGPNNTAVGAFALYANITGDSLTAVGTGALQYNTIGNDSTAVGVSALENNTIGIYNVAVGYRSGFLNVVGNENVSLGWRSLYSNTNSYNTAIGSRAAYYVSKGGYNTAIGASAMPSNTFGMANTSIGSFSLGELDITDSGYGFNTAIGYATGLGIISGSNNTILGANVSGLAADLTNTIILADGAGNQRLTITGSGNVGIATTAPMNSLEIGAGVSGYAGNALLAGDSTNVIALNPGPVGYLVANNNLVIGGGNNYTNMIFLSTNQNVGVGTTTPANKLSVVGVSGVAGASATDGIFEVATGTGASTDNRIDFGLVDDAYGWIQPVKPGSYYLHTVMNPEGGNVGIGTVGPSSKLDVAGDIRASTTIYATGNVASISGVFHGNGSGLTNLSYISNYNGLGTNTVIWADGETRRAFSVTNGVALGNFSGALGYNVPTFEGSLVGGDLHSSTNLLLSAAGGSRIGVDANDSTNSKATASAGSWSGGRLHNANGIQANSGYGSWSGLDASASTGVILASYSGAFSGLAAGGGGNIYVSNVLGLVSIDAYQETTLTNISIITDHSVLVGSPPSNWTNTFQYTVAVINTNGAVTGFNTNGFFGNSIAVTNGILFQSGQQLTNVYVATATLDFGNAATIGCSDLTITVTGAALGDVVDLGVPNASVVANSSYSAWVSSADTVTVRFCALISGDPASGVFRAEVHKWK